MESFSAELSPENRKEARSIHVGSKELGTLDVEFLPGQVLLTFFETGDNAARALAIPTRLYDSLLAVHAVVRARGTA